MILRMIGLVLITTLMGLNPGAYPQEEIGPGGSGQPDAVYQEVMEVYTLLEDGSMVQRHEHKLKYLTFFAVSRILGETFIVYDPEVQELDVKRVVTTMADGTEVACTENSKNEVLPGFCANAPQYMHLREMVVTHLGLERDAVAHLIYEIRSKPEYLPCLMGEELFSSRHPIMKKTVKIRVPSGVALSYEMLNNDAKPVITEEEGFACHTWSLENLPGVPAERMSQASGDYAPRLVFSTCPSWKDAAMLLNRNIDKACWLEDAGTEKAGELRRETTDVVEFVRKVNQFVADEVALADVPADQLGFRPNRANDTFLNNVGSRLDKMVLLVAMLRSQGYFAQPVFFSHYRSVAQEVPAWTQFDECRVICTLRSKLHEPLILENLLFLDPTHLVDGVFEDHLAGRTVFRPSLLNNQLQKIPLLSPEENQVRADIKLTLDEEMKLSGEMSFDVSGTMNPHIALAHDFEPWAKQSLSSLVPGSVVEAVKPILISENKSMFRGSIKTPVEIDKEEEGLFIYNASTCPGGLESMGVPTASSARVNPIWLPRAMTEQIQLTVKIPKGVEVPVMPPQVSIENRAGRMHCNTWIEEGVLYMQRNIMVPQQLISQEDYPALRELLIEWVADDTSRVVFKKTKQS
ncbi:MAG: DUF3857 domain-containing protein [Planctomycetota bacterium]